MIRLNPPKHFQLKLIAQTGKAYVPFVRRMLRRARPMLRTPLAELTVVFAGDRQMIWLHDQFMNLPTTTDVLTFPLDQDARGRPITGEVYVCIPEARRQAKGRGVPLRNEVLLYALHGMLHLCGFDDRTEPEYRRMHDREDAILTRLGVGRVFRPEGTARQQDQQSRPRLKARGKHE